MVRHSAVITIHCYLLQPLKHVFDVYHAGALEGINAKGLSINAIIVAAECNHTKEDTFAARITGR